MLVNAFMWMCVNISTEDAGIVERGQFLRISPLAEPPGKFFHIPARIGGAAHVDEAIVEARRRQLFCLLLAANHYQPQWAGCSTETDSPARSRIDCGWLFISQNYLLILSPKTTIM
jgi:hypothetical protein